MMKNITEYFEETIRSSDKVAIIDGEQEITFSELINKSNKLAEFIISHGAINTPIAVYLPKSADNIVCDLGIVFSGNAYMNLDIKSPIERIRNIIELVRPSIIITNTKNTKILSDFASISKVINLDNLNLSGPFDDKLIQERLSQIIDTDPLCIINTSGSTGTPKGVVLNHRSFIDFTDWALDTFNFSSNEIIGSLSPVVFDIYSFELCLMMAKGSTITLIPDVLAAFPVKILELLQKCRVSFIFWVPTIMVNIANLDLLRTNYLRDLKLIWFAGEVFPTKQFNYWRKSVENAKFVNMYGPIEITLDCTFYIVEREIKDNEPIPIGNACKNTDILILNSDDKLVNEGEEGELCVRGSSLAMGYYNNPEKTALAFTQNPLNKSYPEMIYRTGDIVNTNSYGEIVFKGRKDSLIKHLGYRIELGEIEHVVVNTLKMIENGCVIYNSAKKQIVLFYEAKQEITAVDFRNKFSKLLPKYMIPTMYIQKNTLPRNSSGKIDRLALSSELKT
jgi:amino acid adenylation domain-containing protein